MLAEVGQCQIEARGRVPGRPAHRLRERGDGLVVGAEAIARDPQADERVEACGILGERLLEAGRGVGGPPFAQRGTPGGGGSGRASGGQRDDGQKACDVSPLHDSTAPSAVVLIEL